MTEARFTEMPGSGGPAAALRRVLLAVGVGAAVVGVAWMALWLAMKL
jgi:hypothetical protein